MELRQEFVNFALPKIQGINQYYDQYYFTGRSRETV